MSGFDILAEAHYAVKRAPDTSEYSQKQKKPADGSCQFLTHKVAETHNKPQRTEYNH
jgi:hypothetical protein